MNRNRKIEVRFGTGTGLGVAKFDADTASFLADQIYSCADVGQGCSVELIATSDEDAALCAVASDLLKEEYGVFAEVLSEAPHA